MLNSLLNTFYNEVNSLRLGFSWDDAVELFVIVLLVAIAYKKLIKNTQSEKLVKGVVFLFFAWVFSEFLIVAKLQIIGMFLKACTWLVTLSLIVVFQPELRRFLGYLGQPGFISIGFWKHNNSSSVAKTNDVIKEIVEAAKYLSKTRTGALIVFQKDISANNYYDVGTKINADVKTELILTIFHPNTPLHDGAMVIDNNRISSCGVLLPLTEDPTLSWKYGTRHRAAIGMSEVSDAACLVVSEETGDVSICLGGTIKKYEDLTTLKKDLEGILGCEEKDKSEGKTILKINNLISIKKNEEKKNVN